MNIHEKNKKPLVDKIEKLETEILSLKNIILQLHMDIQNLKMSIPTNSTNGFLLKQEIEKVKKKKGWLWDY